MNAIKLPTLIIQGTNDFQIPVEMGTKLYAAAAGPKQLLTIAGGGHDNHISEADLTIVRTFIQTAEYPHPPILFKTLSTP